MMLRWQWPWALVAALLIAALVCLTIVMVSSHRRAYHDEARIYGVQDDLETEHAGALMRVWRRLNRIAVALLACALVLSCILVGRPAHVDAQDEQSSNRDIILCLDVSGSTLPYDHQVLSTYLNLLQHFKGERIGLSIFNSSSRTVFPLTDDYAMVTEQLTQANDMLKGVQTQDDIDKMSDEQYQQIADWLEGTQNRKNATSLIGDGLVGCAAMLPGFAYSKADTAQSRSREASIVLATDNVVSAPPPIRWLRRLISPPKPASMWTVCIRDRNPVRVTPRPTRCANSSSGMAVCSSPSRTARRSMNWCVR